MSKILKRIRAGRMVYEVLYTSPTAGDSPKARAQKQKASTLAREKLNFRTSVQKLERTLADNFDNGDLFLTTTYDDKHLPENRDRAMRRLRGVLSKLRANRKARGQPLRYIYVTEGCYPGGRIHHHLVINSTGEDLEELRRLWSFGDIELRRLVFDKDHTYEDLASYLTKEPREWGHPRVGERTWTPSLGLVRSEPETMEIPDSLTLAPPPEALAVSKTGPETNGYGEWCWMKYMLPYSPRKKRPRAKRKRRKKE